MTIQELNLQAIPHLPLKERLQLIKQLSAEDQWAQGLLLGDEWANILTHGLGFLLSLVGFIVLIFAPLQMSDYGRLVTLSIYGVSLVTLYAASTLYHFVKRPALKKRLRQVDHCAIYLLIAGSYTPFTLLFLESPWGGILFSLIWILAGLGIFSKIFFMHRFKRLSTVLYLMMGWLAIVAAKPFITLFPYAGLCWLIAGGLAYTGGVLFLYWTNVVFITPFGIYS